MYISADDKARIPVGEPGLPVVTGVRDHNRSLVPARNVCAQALDHDFHIHGIVPSVALFVSIPESANGSFYQGKKCDMQRQNYSTIQSTKTCS